jgi:hypothetical protein
MSSQSIEAREKRRVKITKTTFAATNFISPDDDKSISMRGKPVSTRGKPVSSRGKPVSTSGKPVPTKKYQHEYSNNDAYSTIPIRQTEKTSSRRGENDTFANVYGVSMNDRAAPRSRESNLYGQVLKSSGYGREIEPRVVIKSSGYDKVLESRPLLKPIPPPILTKNGTASYAGRRGSTVSKTRSTELHLPATIGKLMVSSPICNLSPQILTPYKSMNVASLGKTLSATSIGPPIESKSTKSTNSAIPRSARVVHPEIKVLLNKKFESLPLSFFERPDTGGMRNKSTFSNLGNTCFMNSVMQCLYSIDLLVANLPRAISTDLNRSSPSKGKLTESKIHILTL